MVIFTMCVKKTCYKKCYKKTFDVSREYYHKYCDGLQMFAESELGVIIADLAG